MSLPFLSLNSTSVPEFVPLSGAVSSRRANWAAPTLTGWTTFISQTLRRKSLMFEKFAG